jgi:Asp/Glu/hydantoin racemase
LQSHRIGVGRIGGDSPAELDRRPEYRFQHITQNRDQMVESFLAARALIAEDGADVIIPQGITQCPVEMKPQWLAAELGVPVVEGIGAPIKMAAVLVSLGLTQSRVRWQKEGSQPR